MASKIAEMFINEYFANISEERKTEMRTALEAIEKKNAEIAKTKAKGIDFDDIERNITGSVINDFYKDLDDNLWICARTANDIEYSICVSMCDDVVSFHANKVNENLLSKINKLANLMKRMIKQDGTESKSILSEIDSIIYDCDDYADDDCDIPPADYADYDDDDDDDMDLDFLED